MAAGGYSKVILFSLFVAFGGFLFGYDIGVISGCLIMPDFVRRFNTEHFVNASGVAALTANKQSLITSLLSAGTFVGALAQALTADVKVLGRRWSISIWCTIFTVGIVVQTATNTSVVQICIGRFIAGLGVGAMSAIVPLFIGESAPKALRGTLLTLYQLMIIIGIFLSYTIDLATHTISGSASWRIPVGLQMAWGLFLVFGVLMLPESPRHLLNIGNVEEARRSIALLNACDISDPLVEDILSEMSEGIREENEGGKASWVECFSTRNRLWLRTTHGMMLQFIQQLNGQNFYYYYGATFFQSSGVSLSPYVIQEILGAVSVVGTVPALYLIETWGRRRSLMTGAAWEAVCALIAGLVGHYTLAPSGTPSEDLTTRNKQGGGVLIAFAVLHVLGFSIFWGPTPWVYLGESFPLRVRSKCIALGAATNWVWNFLLSYFAPKIASDIGPLILMIFFADLVGGFFYTLFLIPETKGLSLEQVDEMYRARISPIVSADWQPTHGGGRKKPFQKEEYKSQRAFSRNLATDSDSNPEKVETDLV